jgi:hypothetical protein
MSEHPITRSIKSIQINDHFGSGPDGAGDAYDVGQGGVTRIEACEKSGMHSSIPYLRVWKGEECVAEFCQHSIVGVYFGEPDPPPPPRAPDPDHTGQPDCNCFDCIPF